MTQPLVTERELEGILRRLRLLEERVARCEVIERVGYSTGTYVPTYLGGTTAGATTYTTQVGFYTRVGRLVFFNGRVIWTAATGTGNAQISLPFTTDATTNMRFALAVHPINVTFANGSVVGQIPPGVAFFNMLSPATNAAGTNVAIEAAGDIIYAGYFTM